MDNTHSTETKPTSEWRKREMGALWKKEGKSQQFYSGFLKINKDTDEEKEIRVVVFLNKMKSNEKSPDLIMYESTEQSSATFISHDDDNDKIPDSFID
jgi:hypothetical protein